MDILIATALYSILYELIKIAPRLIMFSTTVRKICVLVLFRALMIDSTVFVALLTECVCHNSGLCIHAFSTLAQTHYLAV